MKEKKKVLIGILSFVPPVYIVFFISLVFYLINYVPSNQWGQIFFPYLVMAHLAVFIINIFMLIIIGKHIINNHNLSEKKKVLWGLSIIITMTLTMPFYWFFNMKEDLREVKELNIRG